MFKSLNLLTMTSSMMYEEKAEVLYKAYREKKVIEPFEVSTKEEAHVIFNLFTKKLIKEKGLAGYKISLVTPQTLKKFNADSPDYGILTNDMIIRDSDKIVLPFKYAYAEVEVIVIADKCREDNIPECIKETYLGIEIPMTRFNAPLNKLTTLQLKADDMVSGALFVGKEISKQPNEVSFYVNDELKERNRPNFIYGDYLGMLRWLTRVVGEISGYVSTGSITGPIPLNKNQKIEVKSDQVSFEVYTT